MEMAQSCLDNGGPTVYVCGIIFYKHKASAKIMKLVVGMYNKNGYHWVLVHSKHLYTYGLSYF